MTHHAGGGLARALPGAPVTRARWWVPVIFAIVAACERVVDLTPDAGFPDVGLGVHDAGLGDGGDGGGPPDALVDGALAD